MDENLGDNVHGYIVAFDPYCYVGTSVLKNKAGLRDENDLKNFETVMSFARAEEPLPNGNFSVAHYCAIHHHLFQDVYSWAGEFRTVRIGKDVSVFCYPGHIAEQMQLLFVKLKEQNFLKDRTQSEFAKGAANFLAELNMIHPFREGNGRVQNTFLVLLAHHASHELDMQKLNPESLKGAMVQSFNGKEGLLEKLIEALIVK